MLQYARRARLLTISKQSSHPTSINLIQRETTREVVRINRIYVHGDKSQQNRLGTVVRINRIYVHGDKSQQNRLGTVGKEKKALKSNLWDRNAHR